MYNIIPVSFQETMTIATSNVVTQLGGFLPKFLGALLLLILGAAISRWLKTITVKLLEMLRLSKGLKETPVESFLKHAEIGRIEEVVGTAVYWVAMLVVLYATVSILGLEAISIVLNSILSYIPKVVSAVLILFFGVLLAGLVEGLVKGALHSISGKSARLFGKVGSYLIVIISVMAAIAELNIAAQFISTLFMGFIAMLALGFGLAFGLGGKTVIEKMMIEWYDTTKKELKD
ncbi:MAG TPA: hypothetical protein DCX25_02990 [Candidatus Pacebacteria bacterium]|nr:hypothetical protein [Candidatus Paceibacterota bacterium]HCR10984.1 hypothetical protein [Candidatus Paceibacterota bacterium]HCR92696.1 hypothetical protein [Candidatus Paceibacterota bacterium]